LFAVLAPSVALAQPAEPRVAFVVGNGGDARARLPTAVNDAGLVGEALRTIGFDVVEGADLNQTDFSRSFRQFLTKVDVGGPNAVAAIYFSGYGFEFDGDNFLVMADARLERDSDIPLDTVRLSDLLRAFAATPARAKIVIADASRRLPFAMQGGRLADGLAAIDAPRRTLVAFSTAPGVVANDGPGPYGAFAVAIAEMVRRPQLDLADVFTRIRLRTHEATQGRQTPWNVSAIGASLVLVPSGAANEQGAAQGSSQNSARNSARNSVKTPKSSVMSLAALGPQPIRDRNPDDVYASAIEQDTLSGYAEFLAAFPRSADAARVRAMLRVRREALVWSRAIKLNTPASIWTYLHRYPNGIYVGDADRRLGRLSAPLTPPSDFVPVEVQDVPLPLPDEPTEIADFEHLMRPPTVLNEPEPAYLATLPAPSTRVGPRVLPTPVLPPMAQLTAGTRRPLASLTGLPGVPGPIATNASQSSRPLSDNGPFLASVSAPVAAPPPLPANVIPLPTPAPIRAAALDRSRHMLASRNCRMRHERDFCR
jgi:hypothetical protein